MSLFHRILTALMCCTLLALPFVPAHADTVQKTFTHKVAGSYPYLVKSFENRVDLPEAMVAQGWRFLKRNLHPSARLMIEREELKATYYYVKVRLIGDINDVTASLDVTLEAGPETALPAAPQPCTQLSVKAPVLRPVFSWAGSNACTAITLMDRTTGSTVWERIALNGSNARLDEGALKAGARYLWAVRHGDEFGRYSEPANAAFRVEAKIVECPYCQGQGKVTCGTCDGAGSWAVPSNPPGSWTHKICMDCNGTGEVKCRGCRGTGKTEVLRLITE